ncbi:unnamed protein product [Calypogeia fissa]
MNSLNDAVSACGKKMDQLIPKRLLLQSLYELVELLQGHHDGGGALPSLKEVEAMLLQTMEDITELEDDDATENGDDEVVDEERLNKLFDQIIPFQDADQQLMATIIPFEEMKDKSEEKETKDLNIMPTVVLSSVETEDEEEGRKDKTTKIYAENTGELLQMRRSLRKHGGN